MLSDFGEDRVARLVQSVQHHLGGEGARTVLLGAVEVLGKRVAAIPEGVHARLPQAEPAAAVLGDPGGGVSRRQEQSPLAVTAEKLSLDGSLGCVDGQI